MLEVCPRCFKNMLDRIRSKNSISGRDGKTLICNWCSNSESLIDMFLNRNEIDKIRPDEIEMEKKFCDKLGVKCRLK